MNRRPTRRIENQRKRQGFSLVAGMDEVGRGALAGPLVAACVILPENIDTRGIKDSKQLSQSQREKLYIHISKNAIQWSVGIIEHTLIDKIGIAEANAQVFKQSLKRLSGVPDFLLIDGRNIGSYPIPHEYIVKGDSVSTSIAAASIVAKVTRDHIMQQYHKELPQFGFDEHKGYGTVAHLSAIKKHGPAHIHRRTFDPIKSMQ